MYYRRVANDSEDEGDIFPFYKSKAVEPDYLCDRHDLSDPDYRHVFHVHLFL